MPASELGEKMSFARISIFFGLLGRESSFSSTRPWECVLWETRFRIHWRLHDTLMMPIAMF